jgi:S1-C subfamily serine protease
MIVAPNLALQIGTPITGTLKIDDRYFSNFEGRAFSEIGISIYFLDSDPIFEALRRGRLVTISTSIGIVKYDLTGTARALAEAKKCAEKYRAFARVNNEFQNWLSRNPWYADPQYSAIRANALRINSELIAEGKDQFSREFYNEVDRRLLALVSKDDNAKPDQSEVTGSGIVISRSGEVLTNFHVLEKCIGPVEIRGASGVAESTTVLLADSANDLVLLGSNYVPESVPRIREVPVKNGEPVAVIGFPLRSYDLTITEGIVSSLSGQGDSTKMTISAPANPGNSGGPVVDLSGEIVGVLAAGDPNAQNTNFAIKQNAIRDFLSRRSSYRPPDTSRRKRMDFSEIATFAEDFTVRLRCAAETETN